MTIDLNCDLGEGAGHDARLMPLISSANIACGGHAGDRETMAATIVLARAHGVAIGAHPGYPDRERFGRRDLPLDDATTVALVLEQIDRLEQIAAEPPRHIKLHGALHHRVEGDAALAAALAGALAGSRPRIIVYASATGLFGGVARSRGLAVAAEAFPDRAYGDDGRLLPRDAAGALVTTPAEAARRALRLAVEGRVEAASGRDLAIRADTLCLHGDGADAAATAAAVRTALDHVGIAVAPPGPTPGP